MTMQRIHEWCAAITVISTAISLLVLIALCAYRIEPFFGFLAIPLLALIAALLIKVKQELL